ncbi:MAG: IS110 family transposase, partial [Nitrospira sp. NTP2]|nr:IS110 family transposase [Nitrospira sp. NTP2]
MIPKAESATGVLFVAIDVAKQIHEVLIEPPTGGRQRWRMVNCQRDFDL